MKLFVNTGFRPLKKLQSKLFLLILLVGIIPISVILPLFLFIYKQVSINSDSQTLISATQFYSADILSTDFLKKQSDELVAERLMAGAESYQGRIMLIDNTLQVVFDTVGVETGKIVIWENIVRSIRGETKTYYDNKNNMIIVTTPITDADGVVRGVFMLCKSSTYLKSNAQVFAGYGLIIWVVTCFISIFTAVFFSIHSTKPLRNTSKGLDDIIAGFDDNIPERRSFYELEQIEDKTNEVLLKLNKIDESRQEFVSNVSHELKTPLTSMKVLADSLNSSDNLPVEMYREFMVDIVGEIDRETKIINDLLSLVKLDKKNVSLEVAAVNMNELIESILKRLKPIAEKGEVDVIFESFRPVNCEVDEVKISLAITNLVENAIKYNKPQGWVHVTLNSDHKYCYLKVKDNGLGIPADSLEHIFERFYRADKSHSREIGGTGLGLAITKSAVVMHRGDIRVASELGEGTEFNMIIPLKYIRNEEEKTRETEESTQSEE